MTPAAKIGATVTRLRQPHRRTPRAMTLAESASAMDLLAVFWRRKWLLLGTMVAVTVFALLAAFQITPRYTSSARLMISAASSNGGGISALSQALDGNLRSHIYGEIEVMRSERLIEAAVDQLGLMDLPEFNRNLRAGLLGRVAGWGPIASIIDMIPRFSSSALTDAERRARERQEVAEAFRKRLDIRPPGVSNVLVINVESIDPRRAADFVNTFTELYAADHLERQFRAQAQTRSWLDKRIAQLRNAMDESELAVVEFLASRRLVDNGRSPVLDRQFADVSQQLTEAKAALAERQTRLEQVYRLRDSEQGLGAVREIRESQLIQRLREQEVGLIRQAAEQETRFGERHPRMINLRAELRDLRKRIRDEEARVIDELENEVRVAKARVATLTQELDKLDQQRAMSAQDKAKLFQLQREAESNQRLYEAYLARLKQASAEPGAGEPSSVEIISPGQVPLEPSYPRKGLIVGFGFLVSIALGVFLVLMVEQLDNGFRTASQLERTTEMPVLGAVPQLAAAERDGYVAADIVVSDPESSYVEAIRSLRTSLMVANGDKPPRTVLFASALSGEGKSSLAAAFARLSALAALKGKVLLIDCDLRRPSVSSMLGLRAEMGLTELFAGEASLEDVIRTDPKTGLHVLPSLPGTANPPELLNSDLMRSLLHRLSQSYDMIVIDSPPLDTVSDARVIARMADATIFVVQWEATPRHSAMGALKQLASAGAAITGMVLHRVNSRRQKCGYNEPRAA